jgi:CRISPR system Cascade subunit CasC
MLADDTKVNVDAAVQVAHAFSVHAVDVEFDYFTAKEELPVESEGAGAAMIETGEFATGTLYRYATVDVDELVRNCAADPAIPTDAERSCAAALAEAFLQAFALSTPSGKKNATAPHTPPSFVVVAARSDRPVSFAAAFEKPLRSREGYDAQAVAVLDGHAARVAGIVGDPDAVFHASSLPVDVAHSGDEVSLRDAVSAVTAAAF